MRHMILAVIGSICVVCASGCRAATRMTRVPRVDLELQGGNRGYVVGSAPAGAQLNTTRQMIEADIELQRRLSHASPTRVPASPAMPAGPAVASAVAANPIAVAVPCHRVVPRSEGIGRYAWGEQNKAWLLDHEKASAR